MNECVGDVGGVEEEWSTPLAVFYKTRSGSGLDHVMPFRHPPVVFSFFRSLVSLIILPITSPPHDECSLHIFLG